MTTITAEQNPTITEARRLIRKHPGLSARSAMSWARGGIKFAAEWGDLEFDSNGVARIERDGFKIHAQYTPDEYPDASWLGDFSATWTEGAIKNPRGWTGDYLTTSDHYLPWYVPCNSAEEARQWYRKAGVSRHDAWLRGRQQNYEDLARLDDIELFDLKVTVSRAGVELATEYLGGIDLGTDLRGTDTNHEMAVTAVDLIDEALTAAKAALKELAVEFAKAARID